MNGFGFNCDADLIAHESVELEGVTTLFGDAGEAIAACAWVDGAIAPAAGCEVGGIRGVIGCLSDDDRVLTRLEYA